jgi:hypothetical protein
MNFYELLRLMVDAITWRNEGTRQDAHGVIDELDKLNAFGTVAALMEVVKHEHTWEYRITTAYGYPGLKRRERVCMTCKAVEQA